jgi:endoglucanase
MAHVLYGALIGGPNSADEFYDLRDGRSISLPFSFALTSCSDYPETEVALDYNAPLLSLTAWQVRPFGLFRVSSS